MSRFTTAGWRFGETRTFKRPDWFFDEGGQMPEEVTLTLVGRRSSASSTTTRCTSASRLRYVRTSSSFNARTGKRGDDSWGCAKLGRQAWNQAPKSFEERFTITPKVAAASRWLVLAELQRDREWERQYAAARTLLLEGKPAAFPAGTYWLRRFVGVDLAAGTT